MILLRNHSHFDVLCNAGETPGELVIFQRGFHRTVITTLNHSEENFSDKH